MLCYTLRAKFGDSLITRNVAVKWPSSLCDLMPRNLNLTSGGMLNQRSTNYCNITSFLLVDPVLMVYTSTYIYKFMYKCFVFNFVFLGVSLLFRLLFLLCTHVHIFNLTNKFLLYLRTIETNEPIEQNEKFWCNDIFGNLHASRL